MSESPDEKHRWTEALDAEGVRAVRRALERSRAGPPGLIRIGQTWVTQSFAKAWLDQYDSHKINREKWGFVLAMAVAVVAFLGWLLDWGQYLVALICCNGCRSGRTFCTTSLASRTRDWPVRQELAA